MVHKLLRYEHSEELSKVHQMLNSTKSKKLLELIQNPQFEFDIHQSSRMLNYFEKNGFIKFHREGNGKRRFSLSNAVAFYFSQYLKELGKSNSEIAEIIQVIDNPDNNGNSELDELIFIATLLLGNKELRVSLDEDAIDNISFKVRYDERKLNFSISKELRNIFFNENGITDTKGKLTNFLSLFLPEVATLLGEMNPIDISSNAITKSDKLKSSALSNSLINLNQLPFSEYEGRYDIIHIDEDDNVFGIEVKQLKTSINRQFKSEKITNTKDQLFKAIDDEINFLIKMKKKIASKD
jgi:DNA-binding transcriptional MerR regulator